MLGTWTDFERTFAVMDELRRRVEQATRGRQVLPEARSGLRWPRVTLMDAGNRLVLEADLPGVSQNDVEVTLTNDVLTVAASRTVETPEGYSVHRQERRPIGFTRSFNLPCKVSGEAIEAVLKDGVLTVSLPKAHESKPRQIIIKT